MNKPKRPRSAMWGRSILVASALLMCAGMAFAGPHRNKLSKDLQSLNPGDKVDVIIQYAGMPSSSSEGKVLRFGGARGRQFRNLNNIRSYRGVGALALAELNSDSNVVHVSPDRPIKSTSVFGQPAAIDYHNETINTAMAWADALDGSGISVAVIDSGVSAVNDLPASKIVYSQDFVTPGGSGSDRYGHGTHVAGIIAGSGADSKGRGYKYTFKGVAPGADIVNLRVLGPDGSGRDSDVIAAIDTAIQLKGIYNIRVINLSMGRGVYESYVDDPLCQAVERAWNAGIFVVVSAGNEGRNNNAGTNGYGTITAPGNDPFVITVGAMNTKGTKDRTDDVPASYSSKGPSLFDQVVKPDIVAPGNLIVSLDSPQEALYTTYPDNQVPISLFAGPGATRGKNSYFILSGTSMAAPMVSGAAALLLQQNPALTPDQLKAKLMKTAFKNLVQASVAVEPSTGQTFNLQADIFTVGAGLLDINAAVNDTALAPAVVGAAESPQAAVDADGHITLQLQPNFVMWGSGSADSQFVMWGSSAAQSEFVMWGSSVFNGTDTAGEFVMWGSDALAGEFVMWGSNSQNAEFVMWGSSAIFGQTETDGSSGAAAETTIAGDPL
jgi:serine protease AprX